MVWVWRWRALNVRSSCLTASADYELNAAAASAEQARQVAEKHEATLSAEHPLEGGFNMVFRLARQTASGSL